MGLGFCKVPLLYLLVCSYDFYSLDWYAGVLPFSDFEGMQAQSFELALYTWDKFHLVLFILLQKNAIKFFSYSVGFNLLIIL